MSSQSTPTKSGPWRCVSTVGYQYYCASAYYEFSNDHRRAVHHVPVFASNDVTACYRFAADNSDWYHGMGVFDQGTDQQWPPNDVALYYYGDKIWGS